MLTMILFMVSFFRIESNRSLHHLIKKLSYPFIIVSSLLILTACTSDVEANLNSEIEKNEELSEKITELSEINEQLSDKYDRIEDEFGQIQEEFSTYEKEYEKIQEENEELRKDIKKLEQENKKLKQETAANKESASKKSANSSQTTQQKSSTQSNTTASKEGQAQEDCQIKGSQNGIYHVPGSTYYSRTTNVVQWFCSEEEAKKAGVTARIDSTVSA